MTLGKILILALALILLAFFFILLYAMYLNAVEGIATTLRRVKK